MTGHRVTVVLTVEEEEEDLAEMEVQAQLEDLFTHVSTTITGFTIKKIEAIEYEEEE